MLKKIFTNKFIIFLALTVLVILGFLGFFHYRNTVFSNQALQLEISGPKDAVMADEISYTVRYKNNGNFVLESPKLVFELPKNSLTEDSKNRILTNLKDLNPGDSDSITFKVRLLGKQDDIKTVRVLLSYMPHNLSARYESQATFATTINAIPIDLSFDLPQALEKNREFTFNINYLSHIDYPLENLSIKLGTLNGFSVLSSEPESLDNKEWRLAVLGQNQGGKISIKGSALADVGSHFDFSVQLGMWAGGTFVMLKEIKQGVQIIQPQLSISQKINGSANYTSFAGDTLNYQVMFKNTGATQLDAMTATAKVSGSAFEPGSSQSFSFLLPALVPGQEVVNNFSIKLKSTITEADKIIKTTVTAGGVTQEFTNNVNVSPTLLQLNVGQ